MKKIPFNYGGKRFYLKVKECNGLNKALGLMFRSRNTNALFFNFHKPTKIRIHSLFVFFPFIAAWLDGKDQVIDIKEIRPFTFSVSCKKSFTKLVEIPLNRKYMGIIKSFST